LKILNNLYRLTSIWLLLLALLALTKAAYDKAKQALSGGLVKTKAQATKESEELQVEVDRLKAELEAYKRKVA